VVLVCCYIKRNISGKTLVHFHGNGELVENYETNVYNKVPGMRRLDDDFADLQLSVLFVEYRGYGESNGTADMRKMLKDIDAIFNHLNLDQQDIIVFGRSIGSIFAIHWINNYPNTAAIIIDSGIADPLSLFLQKINPEDIGATLEELEHVGNSLFNHKTKLENYKGRLLILHAQDDNIVPVNHAEANFSFATTENKHKVIFQSGGHNYMYLLNVAAYTTELSNFIFSCGQPQPAPPNTQCCMI